MLLNLTGSIAIWGGGELFQVLDNIVKSGVLSEELVSILATHCRDSSLMVRKLMVQSLSGLVRRNPDCDMIVKLWVEGVFPLILDVEQKAAERAHQVMREGRKLPSCLP